MAIQSILGGLTIPRINQHNARNPTFSVQTIDGADEKTGFVCHAPKTGNIRKIRWVTRTVGTGATVDVRLETVDLATGFPSGTLFGTNTNGAQVVADGDDNVSLLTALTADAAVTDGALMAVVISNPSSSYGNIQIAHLDITGRWGPYLIPYSCYFTAAAWSLSTNTASELQLLVGFEYDDGSYAPIGDGIHFFHDTSTLSFSSASSPPEKGLIFQLPFPARIRGFNVWYDCDGDTTFKLYDSDGTTVLKSVAHDANVRSTTTAGVLRLRFAPQELVKNTNYRLVAVPNATTSGLVVIDVPTAACMDANAGGQAFHYTQGSSGSWAETTTRRPVMSLVLDGFDDATGGGAAGGGMRLAGAGGLAAG